MQEKAIFRFSAFADEITPDFDGQLAALKELGIPLLELRGVDGKSFTQLTDEEVDAVKQKLQNAGIGLSALGSPIGKIDADGDFEAHLRLFDRIMDIGEKLDCRRIRMFSFYRGSLDEAAFEQKVYEWIEKLLVKAEERGFVLCHENEKDIYGDSPAHEHALLSHFGGRLKAVLDLGNFAFCRMDPSPAYPSMKDYIEYFHIKDADEDGTIVPPGKGVAGLENMLRQIAADRAGKEVILTMEPHLMMFTGLSSLSKLDDIRHKYTFESPFEAFRVAYEAVQNMIG
ncbi:MAG: sugar phosphate isomerase/epimerase [Clostridia bacterium]|nr:sugar phosphate isomerase/epimerase [Clostridia bacterium]